MIFGCNAAILSHARRAKPSASSRFYFVAGELETKDREPVRDQERVVDSLLAAGVPRPAIRSVVRADGRHAEWFWRREFPEAYRWLFADGSHPAIRTAKDRRGH